MLQIRKNRLLALWRDYLSVADKYQLDRWLYLEFKKQKSFGKRDRAWYSDYLFAGLRFSYTALAILSEESSQNQFQVKTKDFYKQLLELDQELFWFFIETRTSVQEKVFFSEKAEKLLGRFLQALEESKNDKDATKYLQLLALNYGWGPRLFSYLYKRSLSLGWSVEDLQNFLKLQTTRAPLWIRLLDENNLSRITYELQQNASSILFQDQLALNLNEDSSVGNLPSYHEGLFEIQDWASQQILSDLTLKKGARVWDSCAGGGGKTLQLASLLKNTGVIFATDIREFKLQEILRRATKSHFKNIQTHVWNGSDEQTDKIVSLCGSAFDFVIVDAPCSSSGTLRRNPDLILKLETTVLDDFSKEQLFLLESASRAVKKGGQLLYGTCSFFSEENEDLVSSFLSRNPRFKLVKQKLSIAANFQSDLTFSAVFECS